VQEGHIETVQPLEQFHNTSEIAQVPPIMCTRPPATFHFNLSTILLLVCSFSIQVLRLHKWTQIFSASRWTQISSMSMLLKPLCIQ